MIDEQLPMHQVYVAEHEDREYRTIQEALAHTERASLLPGYSFPKSHHSSPPHRNAESLLTTGRFSLPTMFREITAWSPEVGPVVRESFKMTPGTLEASDDEIASDGLATMARSMAESWDTEANVLMPHSGGYDSRLLSGIVHKHCQVDPERFRMACWEPEIEAFEDIISFMGWPKECVVVVGKGEGPTDFYAPVLLDFGFLGANLYGAESFYGGLLLFAKRFATLGIPKPNRILAGTWGNAATAWNKWRWPTIAHFVGMHSVPAPYPIEGEMYLPCVSMPWVEHVCRFDYKNTSNDKIIVKMLDELSPGLSEIKNPRFELAALIEEYGNDPYHAISQATADAMLEIYNATDYAKVYPVSAMPLHTEFSEELRHYMRAAVVAHAKTLTEVEL